MEFLSRVVFALASVTLMLSAGALIVLGGWQAITSFALPLGSVAPRILDAIGYVVIAIAVFDVAMYLLDEEVIRVREIRQASEARESLTRFISTIAIAVFLEGLVKVFEVGRDDAALLVYPALLLATGVLLVLGLGVFQRLSATVERQVERHD